MYFVCEASRFIFLFFSVFHKSTAALVGGLRRKFRLSFVPNVEFPVCGISDLYFDP